MFELSLLLLLLSSLIRDKLTDKQNQDHDAVRCRSRSRRTGKSREEGEEGRRWYNAIAKQLDADARTSTHTGTHTHTGTACDVGERKTKVMCLCCILILLLFPLSSLLL